MAQLPPKVPSTAQNWPAPNFSHHHHQNLEEALAINHNPSWLDEFLDFSSSKRGSHRRSMSDSIAFLEAPMVAECRRSTTTFVPGGGGDGNNNNSNNNNNNNNNIGELFERFDDEQLMSMFAEDHVNVSYSNPSSPSDDNSINDVDEIKQLGGTCYHLQQMQLKSEPHEEDASSCKSEGLHGNGITSDNSSNDKIFDPKRVKRILANRQSAQRSRVRKLQYISELERSVSSLQAEVSVLSPRVAFLDHQRLVLNVDNTILKQRIAALAQDKLFKDAHQEALKKEIERLRKIYYQRNLKTMENGNCSTHEKEQLAVN